jgi:hypothetical protein
MLVIDIWILPDLSRDAVAVRAGISFNRFMCIGSTVKF